jgi:hypothetical protein
MLVDQRRYQCTARLAGTYDQKNERSSSMRITTIMDDERDMPACPFNLLR